MVAVANLWFVLGAVFILATDNTADGAYRGFTGFEGLPVTKTKVSRDSKNEESEKEGKESGLLDARRHTSIIGQIREPTKNQSLDLDLLEFLPVPKSDSQRDQ